MKNQIIQTNQSTHDLTISHTPVDFRSLMQHFWKYLDTSVAEKSNLSPKIQITENKESVNITAEIPGLNEKDIDLKVSADGYLCICGEKKNEYANNADDNYFSEISYGIFRRTIQLPWDLDYDATVAQYNNGVLIVSIPKSQVVKQKFKKISITTS